MRDIFGIHGQGCKSHERVLDRRGHSFVGDLESNIGGNTRKYMCISRRGGTYRKMFASGTFVVTRSYIESSVSVERLRVCIDFSS